MASMSLPSSALFASAIADSAAAFASAGALSPSSSRVCSRGVHQRVGVVARLDFFLALSVLGGVRLGVLHHAIDFVVGKRGGAGDGNLLLLARAQILQPETFTMPFASMSKVTSI